MINILIATRYDEDQRNILAVLSQQIDFHIVGIVKDESGSIIKSEKLKPDILILDLQLSNVNELELIRIIRRRSPATAIILLCDNNECTVENYVSLAVMAGICGFLIKESDIAKLAHIINIVYLGGCYINSAIVAKLVNKVTVACKVNQIPNKAEPALFSPVERSIVTFLAQGLSDAQIAKELNICTGTVRNCITEIRHKTKLKSRIEIVIYSLASGFIHLEHFWICKGKN